MKGEVMKFKTLTAITLLTILLSACGNIGGDPLNGTSWQLSSLGGVPPVVGTTATLAFENGQANGNSGCNSFGGEYRVSGDKLEFKQMMSTLMACADPAAMEQESILMQFLGDAQRFEVADGQLQIFRSDGDALIFVSAK